jgi:cytochrome c556
LQGKEVIKVKRTVAFVIALIFIISAAGTAVAMEQIPKIMVLRLATMQKLIAGLALSDFDLVKKTADKFADTVKSNTEILPSEGLKAANTHLEKAIKEFSEAVGKKDPSEITAKFGGIIGACYGCHAKFRDVK